MTNEEYCLVLSGGGAKGVYHIGTWRALRELGIPIGAVVGNSIGAVIAAFVAQDLHEELEDIGSRIGLDYVLNVPKDLMKDGELSIDLKKRDAFREFYRNTASRKGLDTSPFRKLMEDYIDEEAIRSGNRDFGVVTYNVTDMKPRQVFLEEMELGELISYAMASSAFPGFVSPQIAGKKYIDGGVWDNIPFAMARSRGYRNIIVVDISGVGLNRKPDIVGTRTIYIKNSIDMGGTLDFDRKFLDEFNILGYLDTMRTFGRYRGIDYFIEPDEKIEESFEAFLKSDRGREALFAVPTARRRGRAPESADEAVRRILPKKIHHDRCRLPLFADCAAQILALPRVKAWKYDELFDALFEKEKALSDEVDEVEESDRRETERKLRRELKARQLMRTPYFYYLLGDRFLPERLAGALEGYVANHHPELATGVCFLEMMEEFRIFREGARV